MSIFSKNTIDVWPKSYSAPTLTQLNEARVHFNTQIGFKYAYFSPIFLLHTHVERQCRTASLDYTRLSQTLPPPHISGAFDPNLDVNTLDNDQRVQLCRLMSRSAGRINFWKMFMFDSWLRQMPTKKPSITQLQLSQDPKELIFNNISSLSLSKAFIIYHRLMIRCQAAYSQAVTYRFGTSIYFGIQVTFANDFCVESLDSSVEECVSFVMHRSQNRYQEINSYFHSDYLFEEGVVEKSSPEALVVEGKKPPTSSTSRRPERLKLTKSNFDKAREAVCVFVFLWNDDDNFEI